MGRSLKHPSVTYFIEKRRIHIASKSWRGLATYHCKFMNPTKNILPVWVNYTYIEVLPNRTSKRIQNEMQFSKNEIIFWHWEEWNMLVFSNTQPILIIGNTSMSPISRDRNGEMSALWRKRIRPFNVQHSSYTLK